MKEKNWRIILLSVIFIFAIIGIILSVLFFNATHTVKAKDIQTDENISQQVNSVLNKNASQQENENQQENTEPLSFSGSSNEIYKGYMYYGTQGNKETTYDDNYIVNISDLNNMNGIIIDQTKEVYTYNDEYTNQSEQKIEKDTKGAIYFKSTNINKAEMISLLGSDNAKVTIKDGDGNVIEEINKDTPTDENGNIVINYKDDSVKKIKVETTAPVGKGTLSIKNKKAINAKTGYTKEELKQFQNIEETLNFNGTEFVNQIKLQDTNSEAKIEVNEQDFSTLKTNENVQITVKLLNYNNTQELFKNPEIQIILPKEVESVNVKNINKIYADEFQFGKPDLEKLETGERLIRIPLIGEQTSYIDGLTQGATVVVDADITFAKTTPTMTSNIILKYTNENQSGQVLENQVPININSKYGMFVYSKVSEDGNLLEEQTDNENSQVELNTDNGNKTIQIERNIINNYDSDISNLVIIGEVKDNPDLQIGLMGNVQLNNSNAKVYYSDNVNTPLDSDAWTEDASSLETIKKYKIVVENNDMSPANVYTLTYNLKLPENINYEQNTYDRVIVDYTYNEKEISGSYTTNFKTPEKPATELTLESATGNNTSAKVPTVTVKEVSGQKELNNGDEIYGGQTVKVILTVNNDTGADISNLHLKATQTNAVFYGLRVVEGGEDTPGDMPQYTYYEEVDSITEKDFDAEVLKQGETVSYEYEFSVKPLEGQETTGELEISSDNFTAQTTQLMSNPIKKAQLKLNIRYAKNEEVPLAADGKVMMYLDIENITDSDLQNIDINLPIPENTKYSDMLVIPNATASEEYDFIGNNNNNLQFKIDNLKSNQKVSILAGFMINDFTGDTQQLKANFTAEVNGETFISNELDKDIKPSEDLDISIKLEGSVSSKTVETGDELIYTGTITNKSDRSKQITISDYVPAAAVVKSAYVVTYGEKTPIEVNQDNTVEYTTDIQANEELQVVIETSINELNATAAIMTNKMTGTLEEQYIESNEVSYRLKNVVDSSTSETSIAGEVWLDANKNGQKDSDDIGIEGITVRLMNMETGQFITDSDGNILVQTTNADGLYSFNNLDTGKYAVIFLYDTKKYSLTDYKKEGVSNDSNSDVIEKNINDLTVGMTDTLEIGVDETNDIDMGLIQNTLFDLELNKTITKATTITSKGNSETSYNNAKLAKTEIYRKDIDGSQVIVDYQISIKNNGDIAGYASELTEHIPEGFKLYNNSDNNWQDDGNGKLKSIALANQLINPGETKTLTLSLVKNMTGDNTGTFKNVAKITKSTNENAIKDSKASNDSSSAEMLISVSTGVATFIALAIFILAVLVIIAVVLIIKKRKGADHA